jgi:hypothetical protein
VVIDDAGLKKESEIAAAHVELLAVPSFFNINSADDTHPI